MNILYQILIFCVLGASLAFASGAGFNDTTNQPLTNGTNPNFSVNVGIGSAAPGQKLDVQGTVRATAFVGNGSQLIGISSSQWTTTNTQDVYLPNNGNVGIGTNKTTTAALTVMNGNVGIGTWVPSNLFTVNGGNILLNGAASTDAVIRINTLPNGTSNKSTLGLCNGYGIGGNCYGYFEFDNQLNTYSIYQAYTSGYLGFGTNSRKHDMVVDINGNVGIGTTTPQLGFAVMNGNVGIGTWTSQIGNGNQSEFVINGNAPYGSSVGTLTIGTPVGGSYKALGIGYDTSANFAWLQAGYYGTAYENLILNPNGGNVEIGYSGVAPNALFQLDSPTNLSGTLGTTISQWWGSSDGTPGDYTQLGFGPHTAITVPTAIFGTQNTGANNPPSYTVEDFIWATRAYGVAYNTAPVEVMRLTNTGNVGIGTTTPIAGLAVMNGNVGIGTWVPSRLLDVNGDINIGKFTLWGDSGLFLRQQAGASFSCNGCKPIVQLNGNIGPNSNGSIRIAGSISSTYMDFLTGTTSSRMLIGGPGNVGIGSWASNVSDMNNTFNVIGNIGIGTNASSSYVATSAPNGGMIVEGNVGIGSLTPGTALDVIGTARATNFVGNGSGLTGINTSQWTVTNTNDVYLPNNGNVGIGTTITSAGAALTVMNGNVGIGTWKPAVALDVKGAITASVTSGFNLGNYDGGGGFYQLNGDGSTGIQLNEVGYGPVFAVNAAHTTCLGYYCTAYKPNSSLSTLITANNNGAASLLTADHGYATTLAINGLLKAGANNDILTGEYVLPTFDNGAFTGVQNYALIVAGTGNVGLGTIAPRNAFEVGAGKLDVTSVGNVGIGTTNPQGALTVMNGNVGIGTWVPGSLLNIEGGNVGIGTVSPGTILDVNGTIRGTDYSGIPYQYYATAESATAASGTHYFAPMTFVNNTPNNINAQGMLLPNACSISKLTIYTDQGPGSGSTVTINLLSASLTPGVASALVTGSYASVDSSATCTASGSTPLNCTISNFTAGSKIPIVADTILLWQMVITGSSLGNSLNMFTSITCVGK